MVPNFLRLKAVSAAMQAAGGFKLAGGDKYYLPMPKSILGKEITRETYGRGHQLKFPSMAKESGPFSPEGFGGYHPSPFMAACLRSESSRSLWIVVRLQDSSGFYGQVRDTAMEDDFIFLLAECEAEVGEIRHGVIRDGFGWNQSVLLSSRGAEISLESPPIKGEIPPEYKERKLV